MRHYVSSGHVPPSAAPTPPAWGSAAETPLVWPEAPDELLPGAPADDSGLMGLADAASSPQPSRVQRKPSPSQPAAPPPTAPRQAAPKKGERTDPRLLAILSAHQEIDADRQRIREEKKAAFDATIQRQAESDAPARPRRGRMSVDYVETGALAQGEETPPAKPSPPPSQDSAPPQTATPPLEQADGEDTIPLDVKAIQAKLAEDGIDWRPAPRPVDDDFDAPAPDRDVDDDSPDDNGDGDEGGPPPRINVPPFPLQPAGVAQRAPDHPPPMDEPFDKPADGDNVDPAADDRPADRVEQSPYLSEEDEATLDRGWDNIAKADAPTAALAGDGEQGFASLPEVIDYSGFEVDAGDTRPMSRQGAPLLPPPDFDDETGESSGEVGYTSLTEWVDAHTTALDAASAPIQRRAAPPAPESDATPLDAGRQESEHDAGDTRPMPIQRAPDYAAAAGVDYEIDGPQQDVPPPESFADSGVGYDEVYPDAADAGDESGYGDDLPEQAAAELVRWQESPAPEVSGESDPFVTVSTDDDEDPAARELPSYEAVDQADDSDAAVSMSSPPTAGVVQRQVAPAAPDDEDGMAAPFEASLQDDGRSDEVAGETAYAAAHEQPAAEFAQRQEIPPAAIDDGQPDSFPADHTHDFDSSADQYLTPVGDQQMTSPDTIQPPEAHVPDVPPPLPMSGFPGDDVYETDISALLGGQAAPRRAQRQPAPEHGAMDVPDDDIPSAYDDDPNPPLDLYQAMMGAGMVEPATLDDEAYSPDVGADFDANAASGYVQRAPDDDPSNPPLDLYQAMMGAGMIQPSPADEYAAPDSVAPPLSPSTRTDLLNLLDNAPPPRADMNQGPDGQDVVSRVYQPPEPPRPAPSVAQRVESEPPDEPPSDDVNVDQLARDVYHQLRNRLRIERERRDPKL